MRANPGGMLAPEDVVGREKVIERLWQILLRQSVLLTAERRMGKTSVIRRMAQEKDAGILQYRDLEGIQTPLEFAERVCSDVHEHLSLKKRTSETFKKLLRDFQGTEVAGLIKFPSTHLPPWKQILSSSLDALMQAQREERVIFFWDELPLMLYNIVTHAGDSAGMEVLDVLRELRHQHPQLRMVFTGSIGLHNVLRSLNRAGYANSPVNDMYSFELPNLELEAATTLALTLFKAETISATKAEGHALAEAVDCIPFYIHHVADRLAQDSRQATTPHIQELIHRCITAASDPWELHHYRKRIDTYYTLEERTWILCVLDQICLSKTPLDLKTLLKRLQKNSLSCQREQLIELLHQLELDHYLLRGESGWCMRNSILQRGWRHQRGL